MNAEQLTKQATLSTAPYVGILTPALCFQLELAYVAQWLDNQDASVLAAAATTACVAIGLLRASFQRDGAQ